MRRLFSTCFAIAIAACGEPSSDISSGSAAPTPPSPTTSPSPTPVDGPEVLVTDAGRVRGTRVDGSLVWKGIPYAAPPTGPNRWRETQPAVPWTGLRDGTKFGTECVQTAPDTSSASGGSEDCLTVNVWRPDKPAPAGGWPIMFFVHGGYNLRGSSAYELEPGRSAYDGKALVARDVVFVSINYRLGALGWMGHPALAAESAHGASGNYGTLDQIAALRWVQRNARAFAGDPSRVLVFGQSAGATNTCALVASPLAAGLFHRAVMHSGTCGSMAPGKADEAGSAIAKKLGCEGAADVLACLRAKPVNEVASASTIDLKLGGFTWGHSPDGWVFPSSLATLIATGRHNHVPIAIGVTAHEYTTLWKSAFPSVPIPATTEDHASAMQQIFGPTYADKILAQYPTTAYASPALASVAALTDANFVCPARSLARALSRVQAEPVRRFYFSHVLSNGPARALGAAHGFDLLFVFAPPSLSFFAPSPSERALSDAMIGYLTRFAAAGDPNGSASPAWPPYDAVDDTHLVFDDTIHLGTNLRSEACDFWATL